MEAMAAACSITCTAVTPTNDWITDRRPTEADGDKDGDVLARQSPNGDDYSYRHWSYVGEATPWKHFENWQPPAATEPTPRKFASLTRTAHGFGHTIDAIDDDGVAWWMVIGPDDCSDTEWHQLLPLPGREVAQ